MEGHDERQTGEWEDGRKDRQTDRRMDFLGQTDRQTERGKKQPDRPSVFRERDATD